MRAVQLWVVTLGFIGCSVARGEVTRLFPLRFGEATAVASYLGGSAPGGGLTPQEASDRFVQSVLTAGVKRLGAGKRDPYLVASAEAASGQGGSTVLQLPEGLSQPPVALRDQNAVLARGTADALDMLAELISLLDRPTPMVNVEVRAVDGIATEDMDWGIDFGVTNGEVAAGSVGNAPPSGTGARWRGLNGQVLAVRDEALTDGRVVVGAQVTTLSGYAAVLRVGEFLPYFTTATTWDEYGQRHVETQANAVFLGFDLFVLPRISGREWVTMLLRPTIITGAGVVTAPDGNSIPITRNSLTETTVRVRDGESLAISGWGRFVQEQTDKLGELLGEGRAASSSGPVLIVSPHIIWPQMADEGAYR